MYFFKRIRISTFEKGIVFLKERGDGMAAEDINIAFGKHLRGIRIQLGMNQDDVAAACGIDLHLPLCSVFPKDYVFLCRI